MPATSPHDRRRRPTVGLHTALLLALLVLSPSIASAWTTPATGVVARPSLCGRPSSSLRSTSLRSAEGAAEDATSPPSRGPAAIGRRDLGRRLLHAAASLSITTATSQSSLIRPAIAYTPDPDPLRESLYFISRVQEATVQQERFVRRAERQETLKSKMKLTLRLVEKNYRLLDQITYCSGYIAAEKVQEASASGYEAAEALQSAIDYVKSDLGSGEFEEGQKEFLTENLTECRERLFDFLAYVPQDKLEGARKRIEEENIANRDEFDGDADAGVYNPVVLPWKNR